MDLGTQFFTAAKAQHESAGKWSLIVLVILLYFHLAIAGPFAQQTADKAAIEQALSDNRAIEAQLDPLVKSAATFIGSVDREVTEASTGLRDDLVEHFRMLDTKIQELALLSLDDAAGEQGAQLFGPDFTAGFQQQQQQQVQQQPMLVEIAPILEPMQPALRRLVAEAAQNPNLEAQFSEEIERYITAFIITPAFARANESWATERLQRLTGETARLSADIDAALKTGVAADRLKELQAAVASLRDEAQRLGFAPPSNSDWWRSVVGKDTSIRSMVEAMRVGAGNLGQLQDRLKDAKDRASQAVVSNRQRAQAVDEKLAELEQQARALQAQLGEIGEPLKVISVRLSILAPLLPLIIALAMAALTLWRTDALRRMHFAASLVAPDGEGGMLRRWLQEAAGGTAQRLARREVAIGAAAIAWVLVAWQAVGSLPTPHLSGIAIFGVALAVVVGVRAHHWYRCRDALAFAGPS